MLYDFAFARPLAPSLMFPVGAMNDFLLPCYIIFFLLLALRSIVDSLMHFFHSVYPCGSCICIDGVCSEGIDFHILLFDTCLH